ncbi:hypothetical protein RIF29_30644 [Crotalaria pallida]|uniref:phytol kinase n=1 Tax=Crotalaria pallida TaxID=3830 RepID=A0AAN9HYD0_CROPI
MDMKNSTMHGQPLRSHKLEFRKMLIYVASSLSSLNLNWFLELLGLAEKKAPISDHSTNINNTWLFLLLIFLAIVIFLVLHFLAEITGYNNSNAGDVEVDDESLKEEEQDHLSHELDHYFDGGQQQLVHRTATSRGIVRRHGACAYCGNPSNTRCSRCKVARYCSVECQIRHWRSGHKHECFETETEADKARPIHGHGPSKIAKKSEREGSHSDEVKLSSYVGMDVSSGSDISNLHACEVCGNPSTTRCSRCKAVTYCSAKCLIVDWKWHKVKCIAGEVEENVRLSGALSLEFHKEGTNNFKSPIKGSKDPMKEVEEHKTEWAKHRNKIFSLQLERDDWMNQAKITRERFHSLKKESEHQLFVLKKEKESLSNAEKKASNTIHSLHERLHNLQIAVQESIAEKKKLEEHIQMLEDGRAKMKNDLQEEKKRVRSLTVERNKSHETTQIAKIEVEVVRQELQMEREHAQRLTENVGIAESRAAFAEVAVWTDSSGKPAMACAICLTNEKNLAFGCGHMTCRDCGSKLSKCPICREQITSQIKLFPG